MFGAKKRLAGYLNVIQPWAMGKDNRGWSRDDFEARVPTSPAGEFPATYEYQPIPEVEAYRLDPSAVIFPLLPYDLTIDRLLLPVDVVTEVLTLNQKIAAFNATLDRLNAATERDTRWSLVVMLHAGLIGRLGGAGLYEQFRLTKSTLGRGR